MVTGENAGLQNFLLSSQCFQKFLGSIINLDINILLTLELTFMTIAAF